MLESIIVGTDGSETAAKAVAQAADIAEKFGSKLFVVSAFQPVSDNRLQKEKLAAPDDVEWAISPREDVDAMLQTMVEPIKGRGVDVQGLARMGDPADAILDVAEEQHANLIIVGNKGMTGAKRFLLGSVPNKISHHAPCSVLIIRTT